MKNKKINLVYILLISVLGFLLVYINSQHDKLKTKIAEINTFTNINANGTFVLSSENGKDFIIKKEFTDDKNVKHFDFYFDSFCSDCIALEESIGEDLRQLVLDKKLELRLHPLNFLSRRHMNEYSLKSSSYIMGLADKGEANLIVDFMKTVMTNEYKEEHMNNFDVEKDFEDLLIKLAKTEKEKAHVKEVTEDFYKYKYLVNNSSINIRREATLTERSPKEDKAFFTPFIVTADDDTSKALLGESENPKEDVLKQIMIYEKPESSIGNSLAIESCEEGKGCE